jgi:hypothetical protein
LVGVFRGLWRERERERERERMETENIYSQISIGIETTTHMEKIDQPSLKYSRKT